MVSGGSENGDHEQASAEGESAFEHTCSSVRLNPGRRSKLHRNHAEVCSPFDDVQCNRHRGVLFFLIIPAWLSLLLVGIGPVCVQAFRRTGIYVTAVSTCGNRIATPGRIAWRCADRDLRAGA